MKKNLRILLIAVCSTLGLTAQPSIQWQKCYITAIGSGVYSLQQTTDNGYVLAGYNSQDYRIVKIDGGGVLQWQKFLGGTAGTDEPHSIQQTTDGGYIIAGSSYSNDGDVTGHHGLASVSDYWVVKLDTGGAIVWQKSLGGSEFDRAESIQQTTDGGYIVVGWSRSTDGDVTGNHGNLDYWVVKLDSGGAIEWEKSFGGTQNDFGESIQQTADGGYIISGNAGSNDGDVTGNHNVDYWVVKISGLGMIQWQKCYGGTGGPHQKGIKQTTDVGYILSGYYVGANNGDVTGNHGQNDYWIVKIDSSGMLEWQKSLGGSGDDQAYDIQQTTDGGYIIGGFSNSNDADVSGNHSLDYDYWIVKLNNSGMILWQKCLGGTLSDAAWVIQQTLDGGYIVGGTSESNDGDVSGNNGASNFWVVKLDDGTSIMESIFDFFSVHISPNPVSHETTISFSLSQSENLSVCVYDFTGRLIEKLFTGNLNSGSHELKWDVLAERRIDDGVYFLNIVGESFSHSSKIVVVK